MPKTVLITGTSSGIGLATVKIFAEAGWQVAATSRSGKTNAYVPGNVNYYKLDVTDVTSIKRAIQSVNKDFGAIDVVVNNAGYGLHGIFEAMSDDQIRKQFDTNVFGLMNVTKSAIEAMRPNKSGTIIQVSSMGGLLTFPTYSIYHSSKWAVEGFSESLHYELKQLGIKIKLIEPGIIKTSFYGSSQEFVKPESSLGYDEFVKKVESRAGSASRGGEDPSVVAKTILRAATDGSNKIRYSTAKPAPLLIFLRKVLPERIFYALIRKNYKI